MTLVIAKRLGQTAIAVSDTRVTNELSGQANGPLAGVVKTMILRPDLCLSFAGPDVWTDGLLKKIDIASVTPEALRADLQRVHMESGRRAEFILLSKEGDCVALVAVKNGATTICDTAWIGSQPGFDRYQRAFHEGEDLSTQVNAARTRIQLMPDDNDGTNSEVEKTVRAFRVAIADPNIAEIGDFDVTAAWREGSFCYLIFAHSITLFACRDEFPDPAPSTNGR